MGTATEVDEAVVAAEGQHVRQHREALLRELPPGTDYAMLLNKIDLSGRDAGLTTFMEHEAVALSLKTLEGMDALRQFLKRRAGFRPVGETDFIARRRHLA